MICNLHVSSLFRVVVATEYTLAAVRCAAGRVQVCRYGNGGGGEMVRRCLRVQ